MDKRCLVKPPTKSGAAPSFPTFLFHCPPQLPPAMTNVWGCGLAQWPFTRCIPRSQQSGKDACGGQEVAETGQSRNFCPHPASPGMVPRESWGLWVGSAHTCEVQGPPATGQPCPAPWLPASAEQEMYPVYLIAYLGVLDSGPQELRSHGGAGAWRGGVGVANRRWVGLGGSSDWVVGVAWREWAW